MDSEPHRDGSDPLRFLCRTVLYPVLEGELEEYLIGTVSRDFRPSVFSLNCTPDSWGINGFAYRFEFAEIFD
jgi:hypothetical protein